MLTIGRGRSLGSFRIFASAWLGTVKESGNTMNHRFLPTGEAPCVTHGAARCPGAQQCYDQSRLCRMLVEFLGVPRQRAGVSEIEVQADTLGQLLGILSVRIPSFRELIAVDRLHSALVANLNGERFISDPQTPLRQDDSVLILSADAGG